MNSIDFKKLVFKEPKLVVENSFDKTESVMYKKSVLDYENNRFMLIKTPKFEVSYIDDKEINLLIHRKEKNKAFYNTITKIENMIVEQCSEKCKEWFGKVISHERIKAMFDSCIVRPNSIDEPFIIRLSLSDNIKHTDIAVHDVVIASLKIDGIIFTRVNHKLSISVVDIKVLKSDDIKVKDSSERHEEHAGKEEHEEHREEQQDHHEELVEHEEHNVEQVKEEQLKPGSSVEVNYDDMWYSCKIIDINEDGTYNILYEDGTIQEGINRSSMRTASEMIDMIAQNTNEVKHNEVKHEVGQTIIDKIIDATTSLFSSSGSESTPVSIPDVIHHEQSEHSDHKEERVDHVDHTDHADHADHKEEHVEHHTEQSEHKEHTEEKVVPVIPTIPVDLVDLNKPYNDPRSESLDTIKKIKNDIKKAILNDNYELVFKLQEILKSMEQEF